MKRNHIVTLGIIIALLVSIFGTVSAQDGTTPEVPTVAPSEEPTVAPTPEPGAKFFTHPIVKLLSAYFDIEETPPPVDPNAPPVDPNAPTPVPTDTSGLGPIGKQIAAYHEAGMGFGVLVKLYAMAQVSASGCAATIAAGGTCTAVTADELVTAFKGGAGMGQLFKQYGKPGLMGVGQVRKALKTQNLQETPIPQTGSNNQGNGNGKGKGPKGPKGPKK
jgi:hypothetical protein